MVLFRPQRAVAVVAALVISVSGTAMSAESAAGAPARRATTTSLSVPSVALGRTAVVQGTVRSGARPVKRKRVVLFSAPTGSAGWRRLATVRTNAAGAFRVTIRPTSGARYQARFKKSKRYRSSLSSVRVARVYAGTSFVPAFGSRPTVGTMSAASGVTHPRLRGAAVTVQRLQGRAWVPVGTGLVGVGGRWATRFRHNAPGVQRYRAVVGSAGGLTGTSSRVVAGTIWQWYYLGDLDMVEAKRFTSEAATIAGRHYAKSPQNSVDFWWASRPYGVWNLSYRCATFAATIGVTDESRSDYRLRFVSSVDGAERDWGALTPGQSRAISQDVSGAFRLRLDDQYEAGLTGSGQGYGWGAWGNARVLCSSAP